MSKTVCKVHGEAYDVGSACKWCESPAPASVDEKIAALAASAYLCEWEADKDFWAGSLADVAGRLGYVLRYNLDGTVIVDVGRARD